jgi:hypothetical protein
LSRNNNRTGAAAMQAPEPVPNFNNQIPTVHITTPTHFVSLPSKGLLYPANHPLYRKESIELKFMTAKEEDILASEQLIRKGIVLDRFIDSLILDKSLDPASLLLCDRTAILVESRINGYGPEYQADITCTECNASNVLEYNLENREISYVDSDPEGAYSITHNGTFTTTLPRSGVEVEFRLMTGKDERNQSLLSEKNNLVAPVVTDQLKKAIVSINGNTDVGYIYAFVNTMPAMDSRHLRTIVRKATPDYNLRTSMVCNKCGTSQEVAVPIGTKFFWPDS